MVCPNNRIFLTHSQTLAGVRNELSNTAIVTWHWRVIGVNSLTQQSDTAVVGAQKQGPVERENSQTGQHTFKGVRPQLGGGKTRLKKNHWIMLDCKNFMYTTGFKFRMRYQNLFHGLTHLHPNFVLIYIDQQNGKPTESLQWGSVSLTQGNNMRYPIS